ncbi:MAG: dipeptidyl aminopeptidase [Planctomycetes bacterium]|nr:dipeptidyl aminopeptidase [Planctomycetota bacterium]
MALKPALGFQPVVAAMIFAMILWTCAIDVFSQELARSEVPRFDMKALSQPPHFSEATGFDENGVRAIYYDGVPYRGNPTRVFAYYGLPDSTSLTKKEGVSETPVKCPGVVLIHGGGGTAFAEWVRLWNRRGYAAIAMDVCGCVPVGTYGNWKRHDEGGPPGWDASFDQIDGPDEDQWQRHAISDVILAHSLLGSLPEVDPNRIGVTGISWGGYLTCIAVGADPRFRCAVPVYGCGFLGENSVWVPTLERMGREKATRWLDRWDPSVFLPLTKTPMLWVNGTNDFAYPMDSWLRSARLHTPSELCMRIRMPHGHGPAGENPEEIHVFMNSILRGEVSLAKITQVELRDKVLSVHFESREKIVRGELCYTRDSGRWQDRKWESMPGERIGLGTSDGGQNNGGYSAMVPDDATVWHFNLFDARDCVVSTEHQTR